MSFPDHVALLTLFLDRRHEVVSQIERTLLNVRDKPIAKQRDRRVFERALDACFFGLPGLPPDLGRLQGELAARHVADGFVPVAREQFAHELDPLEFVVRAYQQWDAHRWPGSSGRMAFAQCLFAIVLVRELQLLSLRIWDDGVGDAGHRLDDVQILLDRVNGPASSIRFVRDARWLIHTAQGALTTGIAPYFGVAESIAASFTPARRIELHRAGEMLAGGHLRSQLRYRVWETGRAVDDPDILAITRNSNSMDCALLVHDLVPLLDAYEDACRNVDTEPRQDLATAILQGLAADPEFLLVRLDLLAPSTMIEDLFLERGPDGRLRYSALGEAHVATLGRYRDLIDRLAGSLRTDAQTLDPARHAYSPLGITYGFCADILSNMVHGLIVGQASSGVSLEDVFAARARQDAMLTQSRAWEALPRRPGERQHFEFSAEWAQQVFMHLLEALEARASHGGRANASTRRDGALFVVPEGANAETTRALPADAVPAQEFCVTSDLGRATRGVAAIRSRADIVSDRAEARYLASVEADGHWFGVSKAVMTLVLAQGRDVVITDVPTGVIEILNLTGSYLFSTDSALSVPGVPDKQEPDEV